MASELKVDTIKHTNNTTALSLDTSGNVTASAGFTATGNVTLSGSANNLGTVSNISYPRYVIVKSSQDISGADQRSIGYSTSWTDHMYTGNFTTQKKGDIEAFFSGGHGYEAGAVRLQVLWELRDSSGTNVSDTYWKTSGGSAPSITSYGGQTHGRVQNCFKQGHAANMAHGSHTNHIIFPSVPAGTYNLYVRIANNNSSGTTAIMNYWVSEQDILTVYHY